MALPEPYGSPPGRPGLYVIELTKIDDSDELGETTAIFAEEYGAKKFMELVLADDEYEIEDEMLLVSSSGIVAEYVGVPGSSMEQIMDYDYSLRELAWQMKPPHKTEALWFRHARRNPTEAEIEAQRERGKPKKKRRPGGRSMHRADRSGMTPIADIALGLGLSARDARGLFRKAKIEKPKQGWAWPPDEVDGIRDLLQELKK